MKKKLLGFFLIIVVALLVVGCSDNTNNTEPNEANNDTTNAGENENDNNNEEPNEPEEKIEISMMMHWGDELFEEKFNQHVKEALPHIDLKLIQASGTEEMQTAFANGQIPDIAMGSSFSRYEELELLMDQTPLVETYGLDLSLYDPGVIDSIKAVAPNGELYALPVIKQAYAMSYNKDIFDAFGVPYPTDNMTWDEVIELGRKLTGEVDGTKYHGIFPGSLGLQQVGSTLIDPETNETTILDNKELRTFLERIEAILNIPGNLPDFDTTEEQAAYMHNAAGSDTLFDFALFPFRDSASGNAWREAEAGLNFDFVTYPVWGGEYPDYTPHELLNFMFVTSESENPEAAFEVIAYFMSEEYQRWSVSTGTSTYMLNEDVYQEFGKQLEHADILAEKNLDALFAYSSAPIPKKSPYQGSSLMMNAFQRIIEGEDLNTVIRLMDEEAETIIAEALGRE